MKKFFITLIFTFCLCPLGLAQIVYQLPDAKVFVKEIVKLIPQSKIQPKLYLSEKDIQGIYKTIEQNKLPMTENEYLEFYNKKPIIKNPEMKETKNYKQATINIPSNYLVYDIFVDIDKKGVPYLYTSNDVIKIEIDGKDSSFKLDYEIHFIKQSDEEEFIKLGRNYDLSNKPLRFIINYDPKYFTLKKVNNYGTEKTVPVVYNGENINLNTVTNPILYLEDKEGNDMEFVLEPNFQNLYNDFKFVREGHKEVKFIDVK